MSLSQGGQSASSGSDLAAMLAIMSSPEALQAKMKEFADAQHAAEEAVARVGAAEDVMRLRDEAAHDRAAAQEELAAAHAQARHILDQATAAAERAAAVARAEVEAHTAEAAAVMARVAEELDAGAQAAAELSERSRKLDARERALAQQAEELESATTNHAFSVEEHERAVATLRDVREQMIATHIEHMRALGA